MTLQTGLFLVLLLASISFFVLNARRLIRTLAIGKADNRTDRPLDRLKNVLIVAFGQSKLLREPVAGVMHFFIFWGFVILLLAILETVGEGFSTGFTFSFLGPLYPPLVFLQELLGLLVACSVLFALFRRYVLKPKRLEAGLLLAILETVGEVFSTGFTFSFLGPLYPPLVFLQELLGLLVAEY